MLCDICHKREAAIHITEIINDEVKELHVCQKCAEAENIKMQQAFGMADLLSGLVEFPSLIEEKKELKCPACGMTYSDFRRLGKLGCGDCYKAFRNVLLPLLKNIHGSTHHMGKEPERIIATGKGTVPPAGRQVKKVKAATKEDRIAELKEKLKKAIQAEEYEQAAVLRDRIRALEGK
ncbi:MAG: UvrB/UvrC motif-containing protein [Candidatus Omnitrophota bacterium]|nr:MAG: UvrB/UvrC motif-containing protein [Candidatus Omnitrophota bacterium]